MESLAPGPKQVEGASLIRGIHIRNQQLTKPRDAARREGEHRGGEATHSAETGERDATPLLLPDRLGSLFRT
jgi:hypothetical protein